MKIINKVQHFQIQIIKRDKAQIHLSSICIIVYTLCNYIFLYCLTDSNNKQNAGLQFYIFSSSLKRRQSTVSHM